MTRKEVSRRIFRDSANVRVVRLNYDALSNVHRDEAHGLPCMYCWEPMDVPTWDHVIPLSKGGPNNRGNLVVVCRACNQGKSDLSLPEYEGYLLGFGSPQGRKVAAFTDWIVRDWSDEEKAQYKRLVAGAWAVATREKTKPDNEWPTDIRLSLSRLVRSMVLPKDAPLIIQRRPYTLRDLRRGQ